MQSTTAVLFETVLVVALAAALWHLLRQRRALRAEAKALAEARREHERGRAHLLTLSELNRALKSSDTLEDAIELIGPYLPRLFEAPAGALYLVEEPGVALPRAFDWGETAQPASLLPSECHALRGGGPYAQPPAPDPHRCPHLGGDARSSAPADVAALAGHGVRPEAASPPVGSPDARQVERERADDEPSDALCIPLTANGVTLALLSLLCPDGRARALLASPYTASAIEQIELAIWNLKLRETLRQQSIRDPLTRLYNRRYLEESMVRELVRTERRRRGGAATGLAVLMIDVDHFKRFNDEYGHEAGDAVLAAIGHRLRGLTRGSDIASRYGGEEFVLALSDVTLADALARAEQIRTAVGGLALRFGEQPLPGATISVGVASYPEHGHSPASLIRAADAAMYQAKRAGRDRVRAAEFSLPYGK